MRFHAREHLVKAGVCQDKQCKNEFDIEQAAGFLYQKIHGKPGGYDQRELMLDLIEQGWEDADYQLALGLLQRRHKVVLVAD